MHSDRILICKPSALLVVILGLCGGLQAGLIVQTDDDMEDAPRYVTSPWRAVMPDPAPDAVPSHQDYTPCIGLCTHDWLGVDWHQGPGTHRMRLCVTLSEALPSTNSTCSMLLSVQEPMGQSVGVERRPCLPLGLTIFRSRSSKKQFNPVNDSDEWQIIYSRASMVC